MNIRIDNLAHTHFRLKDFSPQMNHPHHYIIRYRNRNRSSKTYFCGTCTFFSPNPSNRVTYKHEYLFSHKFMAKHAGNYVYYQYHSRNKNYIQSELFVNIAELGEKTLKSCGFKYVLIFESFRVFQGLLVHMV